MTPVYYNVGQSYSKQKNQFAIGRNSERSFYLKLKKKSFYHPVLFPTRVFSLWETQRARHPWVGGALAATPVAGPINTEHFLLLHCKLFWHCKVPM